MKINLPSPVKVILKAAITIGALWFVFSRIPLRQVWEVAEGTRILPLIIAALLFIISKFFAALRLNIFFRFSGIIVGEIFNLKLYLLGMFYNLFLPGGIGGDGYKIYLLNRKSGVKARKVFWAVLTDRLSGVMALAVLSLILYYFTPLDAGIFHIWIALAIPLGIFFAWWLMRNLLPMLSPAFIMTSLVSLLVQGTQLMCAVFILYALGNTSDTTSYLFLFLISSVVAMLPLTIGGVGSREFTFLVGSGMLGLDTGISITLSLVFYLITLLVSFTGIIYIIKPGDLKLAEDNEKDS